MGGEIYELPSEKLIQETTERVTAEVTAGFPKQLAELEAKIAELEKNHKPA